MKNLKITLSITALFIASHAVQATELQEQNAPTNQEALYRLELQSIYQSGYKHESELIGILCSPYPACDILMKDFNQLPETLVEPVPSQ